MQQVPAAGPIRYPPSTESAFASSRFYFSRVASRHPTGRHPRFFATKDSCVRLSLSHVLGFNPRTVGLCRLLPASAEKWPFPTLSPQSLYGCPDTYTWFPSCAHTRFFPEGFGHTSMVHMFGSPDDPALGLCKDHISGLQSFLYGWAPINARLPDCFHHIPF